MPVLRLGDEKALAPSLLSCLLWWKPPPMLWADPLRQGPCGKELKEVSGQQPVRHWDLNPQPTKFKPPNPPRNHFEHSWKAWQPLRWLPHETLSQRTQVRHAQIPCFKLLSFKVIFYINNTFETNEALLCHSLKTVAVTLGKLIYFQTARAFPTSQTNCNACVKESAHIQKSELPLNSTQKILTDSNWFTNIFPEEFQLNCS